MKGITAAEDYIHTANSGQVPKQSSAIQPLDGDGAQSDFRSLLKQKISQDDDTGPPGASEREKIGSMANASENLVKLQPTEANIPSNPAESKLNGEVEAVEQTSRLKEVVAQNGISTEHALSLLENRPQEARNLLEQYDFRSLLHQSQQGIEDENRFSSREAWLNQAHEEAANLRKRALENALKYTELEVMGTEAWFEQIWPLPQTDSVLNHSTNSQVPYNPEKLLYELTGADEEVGEWDNQFEEEWKGAEAWKFSGQNLNPANSNASTMESALFQSKAQSAFQAIPNSEQLFSELVKRIQINLQNDHYRMNLELHPEYLGQIKMKLDLQGESLKARFLVENESVRKLMASKLDELKDSLQKAGITVSDVEIALLQTDEPQFNPNQALRSLRYSTMNASNYELSEPAYFQGAGEVWSKAWVV